MINDEYSRREDREMVGKLVFLSGCPYLLGRGCEVLRPSKPHAQRITWLARQSPHESGTLPSLNTAQRTYIVRMVGLVKMPVGLLSNEVGVVVFRGAVRS
ncbi:MAG: hypothetical protein IPN76_20565 [Saprospiraceae bacterium]|nr:hypothetical protein [Saprospiraceae bacterium]